MRIIIYIILAKFNIVVPWKSALSICLAHCNYLCAILLHSPENTHSSNDSAFIYKSNLCDAERHQRTSQNF